MGSQHTPRCI